MKRILCFIGLHKWFYGSYNGHVYEYCKRVDCEKKKVYSMLKNKWVWMEVKE